MLVLVVITALAFDFTNGFHDTGNAMATSIATGALSPRVAVAISGVLNFVGALLSLAVAATIANGLVNTADVTLSVIAAGRSPRASTCPATSRSLARRRAVALATKASPGRYQGSSRPSRVKVPVGPPFGRVTAHTTLAAACAADLPLRPTAPSVATCPGPTALTSTPSR